MFRSLTSLACGLAVAAASCTLADDNDLFSSVRPTAVFGDNTPPAANDTPRRVTDAERLGLLLTQAGFETQTAGERIVSLKKQLDPWTFPVLVVISEDETFLGIVLALSVIEDTARVSSSQLLKLLEANQKHTNAHFAFSSERKRTELFSRVENNNVTGQLLRDEINRLAVIARDTSELWKLDSPETAERDPQPEHPTKPETAPTGDSGSPTPPALAGRWSAVRSKTEAFAVEFAANGTFKLVYVNNGKQSKSSGTFAISGSRLSLTGSDGTKLEGSLSNPTATTFQFQPQNSAVLTFNKAS